jgi:hypothetical protein
MKPFDFAQDRLRAIQEAGGKVPGFHPGYDEGFTMRPLMSVILSAAKNLTARPFAEFILSVAEGLRVTTLVC